MKVRLGYTLAELLVATLLCGVIVSTALTVALTSKQGGALGERRLAASMASQAMLQKLKQYLCSDPANTMIPGPSGGAPGAASWSLNAGGYTDDNGGATPYALAPGVHNITGPGVVPPAIAGAPYNGTLSYNVNWSPAGCYAFPIPDNCQPNVNVTVNWTEP